MMTYNDKRSIECLIWWRVEKKEVFEEFSGVAGKGLKYVSQKKIMDRRTIRE
jgi:hypothetical protein